MSGNVDTVFRGTDAFDALLRVIGLQASSVSFEAQGGRRSRVVERARSAGCVGFILSSWFDILQTRRDQALADLRLTDPTLGLRKLTFLSLPMSSRPGR